MSSLHRSNILSRMFLKLSTRASEKLDATHNKRSGRIQQDVNYDIKFGMIKKILNTLEQKAAKNRGYFQFEGLHVDPSAKDGEGVIWLMVRILAILLMASVVTYIGLGVTYDILVEAGLSGLGLRFGIAMVGVFSFIVNIFTPFKNLVHSRIVKRSLGISKKSKIHQDVFDSKVGKKGLYTPEEERFFHYDLYVETTNEIIKNMLKSEKLPGIEELEAMVEGYPDELKAQVWLTYNCFDTAQKSGLKDIILLNQFSVRAALYEKISEDDQFVDQLMEDCEKEYIPLDVFTDLRQNIFSWIEKNGADINRSGFVRDYFYGDRRWKEMSVRSKYYAFSELCDDLPIQASYIAIYQALRHMHYASKYAAESAGKVASVLDRKRRRALFKETIKKMLRRNDWQQRKTLSSQWYKGGVATFVEIVTFVNALLANSITVIAVGAGTIASAAAFLSVSEIFLSALVGVSAFYGSLLSIRPAVKKQVASFRNNWFVLMREECGKSKLIADSFRCGWDQLLGLLIASGMATLTALFTMLHARSMVKLHENKVLAVFVQVFFTVVAPWLQPFYVPLVGVVSFLVAFFFYSRIAQFYRVNKFAGISLNWRMGLSWVKRQNGFKVLRDSLLVLVSLIQTKVVYECIIRYLAGPYIATRAIGICTFLTMYALNAKALKGIKAVFSDLYNSYFYVSSGKEQDSKTRIQKLFQDRVSKTITTSASMILGTPRSSKSKIVKPGTRASEFVNGAFEGQQKEGYFIGVPADTDEEDKQTNLSLSPRTGGGRVHVSALGMDSSHEELYSQGYHGSSSLLHDMQEHPKIGIDGTVISNLGRVKEDKKDLSYSGFIRSLDGRSHSQESSSGDEADGSEAEARQGHNTFSRARTPSPVKLKKMKPYRRAQSMSNLNRQGAGSPRR